MIKDSETQAEAAAAELVIRHEIEAPRELVYKAWTEAVHLAQWWGPKGFTVGVSKLEVKPGGIFHYNMQAGDGPKMWGKFAYHEVSALERLVYTSSFSNADANTTRAPFSATWPLETLNTLTLEEQDDKTILTLSGVPANATSEEQRTFEEGIPSMQQGFAGTMEQLKSYLAKVQMQKQ